MVGLAADGAAVAKAVAPGVAFSIVSTTAPVAGRARALLLPSRAPPMLALTRGESKPLGVPIRPPVH